MESKPLLSDFDAQIKYYQRLETQIEELPGSYHIGPVEYLTDRIKEALVTETKAWKQAFGKALAEKVTIPFSVRKNFLIVERRWPQAQQSNRGRALTCVVVMEKLLEPLTSQDEFMRTSATAVQWLWLIKNVRKF